MSLYDNLAKNETCVKIVKGARQRKKDINKKKRVKGKYKFINRKKDYDKLCIILAGYKEFLYDDVFGRIKKYIPKDIDVCIVSSGLYSDKLEEIANENEWSYLSVKQNKVTLVQNIAINLFKKAKMIFKLDEDIFVTKHFFSGLLKTYEKVEKDSPYRVGFVAPLIPINGYAHVRVLEKTGLLKTYEKKFGRAIHNWDSSDKIISNSNIAKFMWGETEKKLRDIDALDEEFSREPFSYTVSAIRFSIGAILFSRDLWEAMGRFVIGPGNNMGRDEVQICDFVMADSRAIIVSENTLVGHFSFGKQTEEMKKYYEKNRDIFKVKEK